MIERFCKAISDATAHPFSLLGCILFQAIWIAVGIITHLDPFPFVFLLTCSNVLQLILIFVLAVAQRNHTDTHAEHIAGIHDHLDFIRKQQTTLPYALDRYGMVAYLTDWLAANQDKADAETKTLTNEVRTFLHGQDTA